jgi:hypothetical protein
MATSMSREQVDKVIAFITRLNLDGAADRPLVSELCNFRDI